MSDLRSQIIAVLVLAVLALVAALVRQSAPKQRPDAGGVGTQTSATGSSASRGQSKVKSRKKGKKGAAVGARADAAAAPDTLSRTKAEKSETSLAEEGPKQPAESRVQSVAAVQETAKNDSPHAEARQVDTPLRPDGTVTYADFESDEDSVSSLSRANLSDEDDWQQVGGKGASSHPKKPEIAVASAGRGNASIASANPFALLPSGTSGVAGTNTAVSRSISIPSSTSRTTKTQVGSSRASSSTPTAEQTKKQRQNAARAAAAKDAKAAEERARVAKLEAHRRQAQMERIREEESKRARSSASRGQGTGGGNRGGLNAKASVNGNGQLVWD
ncbi:unnamed protein product [Parajaminaea phylloscopi]